MKRKNKTIPRTKKRTTFIRIAAKMLCLAAVLIVAFGIFAAKMLRVHMVGVTDSYVETINGNMCSSVSKKFKELERPLPNVEGYIKMYTYMDLNVDDNFWKWQIIPDGQKNTGAATFLYNSDMELIASSKKKLTAILRLDEETTKEFFTCDDERLNMPEIDALYAEYDKLFPQTDMHTWVEVELDSIYINREECSFIPHSGVMKLVNSDDIEGLKEAKVLRTIDIDITADVEGYELIELNAIGAQKYPRAMLVNFHGTDSEDYEEMLAKINEEIANDERSNSFYFNGSRYFTTRWIDMKVGDEHYSLVTKGYLDLDADVIRNYYIVVMSVISAVLIFIALMSSWAKHVSNKAWYNFEDYQRSLINNLAHDMKTPLMAISGYAENARKSLDTGKNEELAKYLDAIKENVFYTDTIVNRTLELNSMNNKKDVKKEQAELCGLAKAAAEKYALLLDEKGIKLDVSGEFTITADKGSLSAAVENLISNAVKYTPEKGGITISGAKNSMTITNDTAADVDTTDLAVPFIKGSRTADAPAGSGLGLAIASRAAEANGLKLVLSSEKKKFTAVLKK